MYLKGLSRRRAMNGSITTLILIATFMSSMLSVEGAQSGRRVPKKNDPPAPVQGTKEEPPPSESAPKTDPAKLQILVVRDSPSMRAPDYLANIAVEGVAERLKQSSALQVTRGRGMSRKQASDYAKASKTEHVLWIELNYDSMMVSRLPSDSRRVDLTIDYTVYAPETGKVAASGRVYERPYQPRVGGVGLPVPVPSGRAQIEYITRQAGEDVADRVMGSLKKV